MDERTERTSMATSLQREAQRRRLVVLVLVATMACGLVTGCQSEQSNPLVGHWSDYAGLFRIELTAGGDCIFDIQDRPEYFPHLIHGTYEITDDGILVLEIDHELSGQFRYAVTADALQLTDGGGRRWVYRRMKTSPE